MVPAVTRAVSDSDPCARVRWISRVSADHWHTRVAMWCNQWRDPRRLVLRGNHNPDTHSASHVLDSFALGGGSILISLDDRKLSSI